MLDLQRPLPDKAGGEDANPYAPPQVSEAEAVAVPAAVDPRVPFHLCLSTPGQRFIAAALAQLLLFGPPVVFVLIGPSGLGDGGFAVGMGLMLLYLVVLGFTNLALAVRESTTLGKRILGMEVVKRSGAPAGPGAIVARTVIEWLISGLFSIFALLDPLSVFTTNRQTIHDRAAGTYVVSRGLIRAWREDNEIVEPPLDPDVEATQAGPGRRVAGGLISYSGMFGVPVLLMTLEESLFQLLGVETVLLVVGWLGAWLLANLVCMGVTQETISRRLTGLRSVDRTGATPSTSSQVGRIALEHGTLWLGASCLVGFAAPLGCIPALFAGRSLYDMAAGIWVVDRGAFDERKRQAP